MIVNPDGTSGGGSLPYFKVSNPIGGGSNSAYSKTLTIKLTAALSDDIIGIWLEGGSSVSPSSIPNAPTSPANQSISYILSLGIFRSADTWGTLHNYDNNSVGVTYCASYRTSIGHTRVFGTVWGTWTGIQVNGTQVQLNSGYDDLLFLNGSYSLYAIRSV